jgi:hypothetical protein
LALTKSQLQTVKTAVLADPTASAARTAGDSVALLEWLNGPANPVVLAWNTSVPPQTIDEGVALGPSGYTGFDALTQGKRDEWRIFIGYARDFSKNKIRSVVTDVWGNATAGSTAESVCLAATIGATNAQNALGGNSRSTGTVTALALNFTDQCDVTDANWLINN